MPRKKGEAINPDAIAKSFIRHYDIATQKDLDRLKTKVDRIENLLLAYASVKNIHKNPHNRTKITSGDIVYDMIKRSKKGLKFSDIQKKTGFDDKKIRNLLFRLHQTGKIKRKSRGVYVAG
jgi:hypothetical protein